MPTRYRLKNHQLAAELAKKRHSQNRWADVLGVGRAHLSLLVNGKRPYPSEDTRRKLLQGLDVPFSTLFEIEEVPMPGSDRPRHHAWMPRPEPPGIVMPLESTFQEIRYALRTIVLRPMFSLIVVVMLALGIAGNSAMFSWVDGMLLRPLRVEQPEQWAQLGIETASGFVSSYSYPTFIDHLAMNEVFEEMFAIRVFPVSFSSGGENTRANAAMVNGAYFRALGGTAAIGRTFNEAEDRVPGNETVAVLGYGFWQRHFAGDPEVVGTEVLINSRAFTVIGVMPENFGFARVEVAADMWTPLVMQEVLRPGSGTLECRGCGFLQVSARVKPGLTIAQADTRMNDTHARLIEEYPDQLNQTTVSVRPATRAYLGPIGDAITVVFAVLMGVIGSVLLIACINVANLLLARGADRSGEMAVRVALGASRSRIVKQLLTESLILSAAAAALGIVLAAWINNLLLSFQPPTATPVSITVALDGRVLLFTTVIAVVTGLVFGIVPALRAAGTNVVSAIHGAGRVSGGNRLRSTLVVIQIATSVALLIGAGLFVRSLQNATTIDPGFDSDRMLLATVDPGLQGYSTEDTRAFYEELLQRLQANQSIQRAAMAEMMPMSLGNQQWGASIEGYDAAENERMNLDYNYVETGYFETMGIALLRGRDFDENDDPAGTGAIIVNETMARRYWPEGDALGGVVRSGGMERTVIGVVADAKYYTLGETPMPFMYFPFGQSTQSSMTLHVRAESDVAAVTAAVRGEVQSMDAAMPIFDIRSLEAQMSVALLPARMTAGLLAVFGGFALLLAAVGLYGVMAYVVGQRTREIGIRMALGARQEGVLQMVIGSAARLLVVGASLGLLAGVGLGQVAQGVLYGVGALDPVALIGALGIISAAVMLAAWLPARRAARVNPVEALRAD
ncbi:MAG: FtsX-like permease family protein [Acidobacteria bacterium]|nr:FtsX-like permease family protein [Acidobacteriota bacterium]